MPLTTRREEKEEAVSDDTTMKLLSLFYLFSLSLFPPFFCSHIPMWRAVFARASSAFASTSSSTLSAKRWVTCAGVVLTAGCAFGTSVACQRKKPLGDDAFETTKKFHFYRYDDWR